MFLHGGLSSIFRVHRGPRRWVFLPHVILLAFALVVGVVEGVELGLLLPYIVLVPLLVIQIALPTFAGWVMAFSGWLAYCSLFVFDECREIRFGTKPWVNIWLLLALVVLSSAPLYLLRPRAKRVGQGEVKPAEIQNSEQNPGQGKRGTA